MDGFQREINFNTVTRYRDNAIIYRNKSARLSVNIMIIYYKAARIFRARRASKSKVRISEMQWRTMQYRPLFL